MRHDWNKDLNHARAKLNRDIRQQCMEILEQKKNNGVTEKSEISSTIQKQVFGGDSNGSQQ